MSYIIKTTLLGLVIAAMLPTILQADSIPKPLNTLKGGYQVLANQISAAYAVPASTVKSIITCESSWKADAHHVTKWENSYGLVQINLKAHPSITPDEATDPTYAITYLAANLKDGKGGMWSCYKQ